MRSTVLIATAAATLAVAGCSGGEPASEVTTETNASDRSAMNDVLGDGRPAAPALPTDAAGFVAAVGASDLYEIESSALARTKAASADLRSFAQRLEREHRASSADLKAAAAAAGVEAAPALDADKQAQLDALKAADGAAFDKLYLEQQRLAHQTTLMLLQNYANAGDNDRLKAFADKARAMVEVHADTLNYMR